MVRFNTVQNIFYKCLRFMDLLNDYYILLEFILLYDKETQTYINAFRHLNEECSKLDFIFSPDTVFVDFEIALHTAIQQKTKSRMSLLLGSILVII
jgi:hypothetical protein